MEGCYSFDEDMYGYCSFEHDGPNQEAWDRGGNYRLDKLIEHVPTVLLLLFDAVTLGFPEYIITSRRVAAQDIEALRVTCKRFELVGRGQRLPTAYIKTFL